MRAVQYTSRGVAYLLLRADRKHHVGLKLYALYMQLSLSRKAFRAFRWLADTRAALEHFQAASRRGVQGGGASRYFSALHWLLMAVHIFWDNMFFYTHHSVKLVDRPASTWWTNISANQRQKNWRAMADLAGLAAAWLRCRRAYCSIRALTDDETPFPTNGGTAGSVDERHTGAKKLASARCEQREAWYAFTKLAADVATYLPQTTAANWAGFGSAHGWHDAYIGAAGCVASIVSCRAEWLKM